jgi:hypothetical protein
MIEVTVKAVGEYSVTTPFLALVDPVNLKSIKAQGSDTVLFMDQFESQTGPIAVLVEETYAQVKDLLAIAGVTHGRVKELWGLIKFGVTGHAIGTHDVVDPITLQDIEVPDGAIINFGYAVVKTTFTSATDAATIALGTATDSAAGLKAAIAISNGANPWDAGKTALIPVGTAATVLGPTTAARKIQYVVAVEALTAGEMEIFLEYVVDPIAAAS